MKNIVIFASGSGSNAENIIERLKDKVNFTLILSNKRDAYVLQRAEKLKIPTVVFDRKNFYESDDVLKILIDLQTDFVVLAGFLWLVPNNILRAFPNKIINIHPALLPKYGGKGMYGERVHKAVVENCETESGITIHLVNEKYDEGQVLFQAKCPVFPTDSPDDVAHKVHELEYKYFPEVIEKLILT
jgi:phosphoribosylglycinamide formyltransferase 1